MAAPIVEERRGADQLKRDAPIIAIFGNPPYRRLDEGEEEAIVSGWDNELNTFPDLYIAFWRWSLWKLFESDGASHRGVVCLITIAPSSPVTHMLGCGRCSVVDSTR